MSQVIEKSDLMGKSDTFRQSIRIGLILAIFSHFLAFGRGILFGRALTPAALGQWALMISAIQVIGFILLLGIPNGLRRYVERYRRHMRLRTFLNQSYGVVALITVVVVIVASVFHVSLNQALYGPKSSLALVWLTLVAVVLLIVSRIARSILQGLRRLRWDSWLELGFNASFLLAACVLYATWRVDVISNACAYAIATLLVLVVSLVLVRWALRAEGPLEDAGPALKTGMTALLAFSLGTWSAESMEALSRCLDRYMLLHLNTLDPAETLAQIGDYFLATRIAKPLALLGGLLSAIVLPHAVHLWEARQEREAAQIISRATKIAAIAFTCCGAIAIVYHELLFRLLVGRVPVQMGIIIAPVIAAVVLLALHVVARSYMFCRERIWKIVAVWAVALAINVTLNWLLIPMYQLQGAVYATLISVSFATWAVQWLSQRESGRADVGMWAACLMPLLLLLPARLLPLTLGMLLLSMLLTNWFLDDSDKNEIKKWFKWKAPSLSEGEETS